MTDILNIAQLGMEADKFKSSQLGQYLLDRATSDIIDASEKLTTVDPTDVKAITELQNQVYRANSFMVWIDEAIEDGNFAIDEIRSTHD